MSKDLKPADMTVYVSFKQVEKKARQLIAKRLFQIKKYFESSLEAKSITLLLNVFNEADAVLKMLDNVKNK